MRDQLHLTQINVYIIVSIKPFLFNTNRAKFIKKKKNEIYYNRILSLTYKILKKKIVSLIALVYWCVFKMLTLFNYVKDKNV